MKLEQVRPCDGVCCEESPRFPNATGKDCIYHDANGGKDGGGCQLMRDPTLIPDGPSPIDPSRTAQESFDETCVRWPQEFSIPYKKSNGACCWQWVDGD